MAAADDALWFMADAEGVAPFLGLGNIPGHIRDDISSWIRRHAVPCPHVLAIATEGVFYRVIGRLDALCVECAANRRIAEWVKTCARCARPVVEGGHRTAFSLAGHALIFGAWCADCWNGENE